MCFVGLTRSLTLTHLLTHLLTHSLTHSLAHSLTHPHACPSPLTAPSPATAARTQMNVLHEPWGDDAISEPASWGCPPALAAAEAADALADTAASGGPSQHTDLGVTHRGPKVGQGLLV